MRVTPKSDEEIEKEQEKFRPLKGVFDFEVIEASEGISKAGNDMIKLTLGVWRPDGSQLFVYDYLLDAMAFKVKHFCEAVGLTDRYEAGDLVAFDCKGKGGRVELKIEKDDKGNDKSVVKDYVKREISANGKQPPAGLLDEGKPLNDEIPF